MGVLEEAIVERELDIQLITGDQAESLVNEEFRIPEDQDWLMKFRIGFGDEINPNPSRFAAVNARSYYVVCNRGRKEALSSLSFRLDHTSSWASICSVARLFRKQCGDQETSHGWQYLEAIIEKVLLPKGVRKSVATLMSEDVLNAFLDLQRMCKAGNKNYDVVIAENNPQWASALISIYGATSENCFESSPAVSLPGS